MANKAFRTIGSQKDTEAWTFSHTISLTTAELLRNTYDQNLVAIFVFGTQRFSHCFRGKFPSVLTVLLLHNLFTHFFSFSIFQSETWVETQKHNCLLENLPWLMLLEINRQLHREGKMGTKWKECPDNLRVEKLPKYTTSHSKFLLLLCLGT